MLLEINKQETELVPQLGDVVEFGDVAYIVAMTNQESPSHICKYNLISLAHGKPYFSESWTDYTGMIEWLKDVIFYSSQDYQLKLVRRKK